MEKLTETWLAENGYSVSDALAYEIRITNHSDGTDECRLTLSSDGATHKIALGMKSPDIAELTGIVSKRQIRIARKDDKICAIGDGSADEWVSVADTDPIFRIKTIADIEMSLTMTDARRIGKELIAYHCKQHVIGYFRDNPAYLPEILDNDDLIRRVSDAYSDLIIGTMGEYAVTKDMCLHKALEACGDVALYKNPDYSPVTDMRSVLVTGNPKPKSGKSLKDAIGVRNCDIDAATGRTLTHDEIYTRAVNLLGGTAVLRNYMPAPVGVLVEKYKQDPRLNNINISYWDQMAGFTRHRNEVAPSYGYLWNLLREHGITSISPAEGVCILKQAAKMIVEEEENHKTP